MVDHCASAPATRAQPKRDCRPDRNREGARRAADRAYGGQGLAVAPQRRQGPARQSPLPDQQGEPLARGDLAAGGGHRRCGVGGSVGCRTSPADRSDGAGEDHAAGAARARSGLRRQPCQRRQESGGTRAVSPLLPRRLLRPALLGGVPVAVILAALALWLSGGRYVSTENAYVKADIAQISAEVSGRLLEVHVEDHAEVKAGDLLLTLDAEPFRVALNRAEAELDAMREQVRTLTASWHEAQSELREAESKVAYWNTQLGRQKTLTERGIVSSSKFEEVESNATAAEDRATVMRRRLERVAAQLGGNPDRPEAEHPMVRQKQAERERLALDLAHTEIRAPLAGTAVNVRLQRGEQIKAATPLFALVAATRPWVEANFKETELTHVRKGQAAQVQLDIYPDVVWQAEIESISPAPGAEFAVLPPQNASGNWVKVVQRLPVRLRLLAQPGEPPLRAGMTATVRVDTERQSRLSRLLGGWSAFATSRP